MSLQKWKILQRDTAEDLFSWNDSCVRIMVLGGLCNKLMSTYVLRHLRPFIQCRNRHFFLHRNNNGGGRSLVYIYELVSRMARNCNTKDNQKHARSALYCRKIDNYERFHFCSSLNFFTCYLHDLDPIVWLI